MVGDEAPVICDFSRDIYKRLSGYVVLDSIIGGRGFLKFGAEKWLWVLVERCGVKNRKERKERKERKDSDERGQGR